MPERGEMDRRVVKAVHGVEPIRPDPEFETGLTGYLSARYPREALIELFARYPETKTAVSPNNIFVLLAGNDCRCLLVDTGPAPLHDYSGFVFNHYWEKVIPEKIKRYREVGYL